MKWMQAIEAFVSRLPQETQPYVPGLFEQVLQCLAYDPNFTDNMEDDQGDDEDEDDEG